MKLDVQWIVGFVDGGGDFAVRIDPGSKPDGRAKIAVEFTVVQHERDVQVLHAFKAHFGCGVVRRNHGDRMAYRVRDARHLRERIVPFFVKHPLKTRKRVDFQKFKRVLRIMEKDGHLTEDGLEEIRRIAKQMNRGDSR